MKDPVLLGVDGGNTKTDFFLFAGSGDLLAHLRTGTCSHEALVGGFADAEIALRKGIEQVCAAAGIAVEAIDSAVLGLAGADTKAQHQKLTEIAERILSGNVLVCNDSMLGIMASAPDGIGVCCINGTATSISGIDEDGKRLQVGGMGSLSSDFAGGEYAAREVLRQVYRSRYQDGEPTMLTEGVHALLKADLDADLMELFHPDHLLWDKKLELGLDQLLFGCAREGDAVAMAVVESMANILAAGTAGCIKNLRFGDCVTIILAGSLWVKCGYPAMQQIYCREVERRTGKSCAFVLLKEPPALGAILEAYRRFEKTSPSREVRDKFMAAMQNI